MGFSFMRRRSVVHATLFVLVTVLSGCATGHTGAAGNYKPPTVAPGEKTALDKYVAAPDSHYSYKIVNTIKGEGYTGYVVDMVSQQYLTEKEVDKPIWQHYLLIAKPDNLKHSTALLYIGGGSNNKPAPDKLDDGFAKMAVLTQSVCAELRTVPSEPLVFTDDNGKKRSEDEIIAYTWDKYMRTGDEKWPLRLPMTKAAVRALDTITAVCASPEGGGAKVDTFMVAGGSKRGWTTWFTAAVDRRVAAIVPLVIDVLNVRPSMQHHHDAYGFWAPAVGDYVYHKIVDRQDAPEYVALLAIEDPYSYRDRFTMPKYIVNAAGDQYFLPDSSQFYFDDLPGEKHLRYVPNADHSLKNSDATRTLMAWHHAILNRVALPQFSWQHAADGTLTVTSKTPPREVLLWQATNPLARDFRLETLGPGWSSSPVESRDGVFTATVPRPADGWTAYLMELTFELGASAPLKLTTNVMVTPRTLPFAPPNPIRPKGFLSK